MASSVGRYPGSPNYGRGGLTAAAVHRQPRRAEAARADYRVGGGVR